MKHQPAENETVERAGLLYMETSTKRLILVLGSCTLHAHHTHGDTWSCLVTETCSSWPHRTQSWRMCFGNHAFEVASKRGYWIRIA